MATIHLACPSCGDPLSVPEEFAGRRAKCKKCTAVIQIPKQQLIVPQPVAQQIADDIECPFCSEYIRPSAMKCKHCGEILNLAMREQAIAAKAVPVATPAAAPVINVSTVTTQTTVVGRDGKRWSRLMAMFLSLVIPGLGQFYKGQPLNALVWLVVVIVGYVAMVVPGLVLHFCCILGAGMGRND